MFLFDTQTLALILGIFLIAGIVKGAMGFGLPVVSITLLPFILPVETALALNALVILVSNIQQIRQAGETRAGFSAAWSMMLGMAIMVPVGAHFTAGITASTLLTVLGSFVLAFVVLSFVNPALRIPAGWEQRTGFGMGLISGFVGALTSAPGPIFVMYVVSLHLNRAVYMAALGFIMSLFGLVVATSYAAVGIVRWEHVPTGLISIVPAMAGMWLGNTWAKRLPVETFRKAVLAILGVLACLMIRRAMT